MSSGLIRTPQTISDAIYKIFATTLYTKIAIKRTYDDWTFKQMWHDRMMRRQREFQKIDVDAHQEIGSDLAVAKFVLTLRGQIQNQSKQWITRWKELPPDYSKNFKVIAVNASNRNLITEGIDNFVGLDHLEFLDLSCNPRLDDFACDQLSRQFRFSKSLREIDLSFNPGISVYGLEILFRIPSLKRIVAVETLASKFPNIDLFVVAAEDERGAEVLVHSNGRKYINQDLEDLSTVNFNKRIASN